MSREHFWIAAIAISLALSFPCASGATTAVNRTTVEDDHRSLQQACPAGWKVASGTIYDSWPKPGSEECVDYSGCEYAGQFSRIDGGEQKCCCINGARWLDGGSGDFACRFPPLKVKTMRVAATYDRDSSLLGKKVRVRVAGRPTVVTANVLDVCNDADCDGCCKLNSSNKRFKLIDLEAQVACSLLGLDYSDPDFDVNSLDTPQNLRPYARRSTLPLCYKVIGVADPV